jgi:hypothetical protein
MWDADGDANKSFGEACAAFIAPLHPPKSPFTVEEQKGRIAGVFLIPGDGQTGTLEHLLLKAAYEGDPDLEKCIAAFSTCYPRGELWDENKKAKRDMHCVIAAFCQDDPGCSLGFIWQKKKKDNPMDIGSGVFTELSDFLKSFSAACPT